MKTCFAAAAAVVAALGLVACSSGDGGSDAADGSETTVEDLPACNQLWAAGMHTEELVEQKDEACTDELGESQRYGLTEETCTDGRKLIWNDRGWGYVPGVWNQHTRIDGKLMPPEADLLPCRAT